MNIDSQLTISTQQACLVEDLDPEAVKTGLAQYQAAYASATDGHARCDAADVGRLML